MKEVTYNSSLLKDSWNSNETVKPNNFNELSGAVKNVIANANDLAHNYLQQGKQYVAGDIVYSKNLNKGCYLVCTQGGATGDSEPQLINKNVGETVTDGAVTWTVQKVSNALSLGGNLPEVFALLNSPSFSGVPTAPTAAKTVNNNQIATTAFVHLLAGAANNGGIVDSLLAQNGYVKFANGLILQWGTCGTGINNLPLSFNEKIFICVVTDITSSTTSSDGYFSFNNDKSTINSIFITSSGAGGGNYIVAGV